MRGVLLDDVLAVGRRSNPRTGVACRRVVCRAPLEVEQHHQGGEITATGRRCPLRLIADNDRRSATR